jgi:hypothetical protein
MKEESRLEPTIALQRNLLGSIDLSDLDNSEETEQERKDYCAAIFAIYPRIEKDLKKFMYEQLLFSSNQAVSWEQVIFGRGTFNGLSLMLEHWKLAQAEHIANVTNKDEEV